MAKKSKYNQEPSPEERLTAEYGVIGYLLYTEHPVTRLPRLTGEMFTDLNCTIAWDQIEEMLTFHHRTITGPSVQAFLDERGIHLDSNFYAQTQTVAASLSYDQFCQYAAIVFRAGQTTTEQSSDIISIASLRDSICSELDGFGDQGYSVGYGPLTDRYFRLDSGGGVIVMTGLPNNGKTDWLRCTLAHLIYEQRKHVVMLSFEEPNKAKLAARFIRLGNNTKRPPQTDSERQIVNQCIDFLDEHLTFIKTDRQQPTVRYIISLIEQVMLFQPVDYVVIDPYLYVEPDDDNDTRETERIKRLLTKLHSWAQRFGIWTFIVAHPKKKNNDDDKNDEAYERITSHLIAGSAHWGNIAEFVLSVNRVFVDRKKGTDQPSYTVVESIKVRDQDICDRGRMYFFRNSAGQYCEADETYANTFTATPILTKAKPLFTPLYNTQPL